MFCRVLGLALLAGNGVICWRAAKKHPAWGISAAAALLGWLIWTGAAQHPDYLAYLMRWPARNRRKSWWTPTLTGGRISALGAPFQDLGATEVHFSQWSRSTGGFPPY